MTTRERTRPRVRGTAIVALVAASALLAGCSGKSHPASSSSSSASPGAVPTQAELINRLLSLGINQAEGKHPAQAQTTFRDVLSLDPGNQYAWYNLGLVAQTQKQTKSAIFDYRQAVRIDPKDTSAMYNEAIALESTDPHQALSLYKRIVVINPKAATAYLRMSLLYDKSGKHNDAVAARKKAIALDPQLRSVG